jgi:hypothetical protein
MQFVKYKWDVSKNMSGEPFLFAKGGKIEKVRLLGEDISFTLGRKICIGYTRNGKHFPCPGQRISEEKMCRECMLNDDFFMCVKCDGSECLNESQRNSCIKSKFYIYLAAFSTTLKVGISQEFRILERLVEQGADMGAKIAGVQDGKLAREVEQKISKSLGIVDRISGVDKQKMLFGNINVASMNIFNAYSKLRVNGVSAHLINPEIYNLQSIYRLSSVTSMPKPLRLEEGAEIEGKVVAAKGNILVLENNGFFSLNLNKLVGFETE